jgi:hypothetical protein
VTGKIVEKWRATAVRALSGPTDIALTSVEAALAPVAIIWRGQVEIRVVVQGGVQCAVPPGAPVGLQALQGLGKGLWGTEDAQHYVSRLRDEWTR